MKRHFEFFLSFYHFSLHSNEQNERVVHTLGWQDFGFLYHLPPWVDIFYDMKVDKKWTFLDHLYIPRFVTVVCERPQATKERNLK